MTGSTRFWDRIATRYARKAVPNEAVYAEKLQITREYLTAEMNLLEFGCGTGTTALAHAPFVATMHGIDSSAKMVAIARSKAQAGAIAKATFEQASIESFNAPDQVFDAIIGLSVLHLIEDLTPVLAKVRRLLKPGGFFVSSTPCLGPGTWPLRKVAGLAASLSLIPLLRFLTPDELLQSLNAMGFVILRDWRPNQGRTLFLVAQKVS
jgi:ubiquinone/menaquinone biosynthesis C-methylase UbiE